MGVVNLTPDSFSDGGKYNNHKDALKRIKHFIEKGSSIIDIGGESTRPGSNDVNEKIEWKRIKEVLKKNKKNKKCDIYWYSKKCHNGKKFKIWCPYH